MTHEQMTIMMQNAAALPKRAVDVPVISAHCIAGCETPSTIQRALATYAYQTWQKPYSIILFQNWHAATPPICGAEALAEICAPFDNVHVLRHPLPPSTPIGVIRQMLFGAIAQAAQRHNIDPSTIVVVHNDIDMVKAASGKLAAYYALCQNHPLCIGQLRWDHPSPTMRVALFPGLAIAQEVLFGLQECIQAAIVGDDARLVEQLLEKQLHFYAMFSNMAWRLDAQIAVGGVPPVSKHEWHVYAQRMMTYARERGQRIAFGDVRTRVNVHARRWYAEHARSLQSESEHVLWSPLQQWQGTFNSADAEHDPVRSGGVNVGRMSTTLNHQVIRDAINATLSCMVLPDQLAATWTYSALQRIGLRPEDVTLHSHDEGCGWCRVRIAQIHTIERVKEFLEE